MAITADEKQDLEDIYKDKIHDDGDDEEEAAGDNED